MMRVAGPGRAVLTSGVLPIALALALLSPGPPALVPLGARPVATPNVYVRLANGLRVLLVETRASPGLAAYYTVVRVGSRNEVEPGHTGFAHFFEHVMFKGTPTWPPEKWEAETLSLGVDANASTWEDFTVYEYFGPAAALPRIVELEADRFRNLAYSEPEFQTEARTILGEYHKQASSPELAIEEALAAAAFRRHTYGHTPLGTLADIKAMPKRYAYSQRFFERHYQPDNCTILVVGDFDGAAVMDEIRRRYGAWKGKAASPSVPDEPPQRGERRTKVAWQQATAPRLVVGWRFPAWHSGDKNAAVHDVLAELLFGRASALHADLVFGRQLVERFDAWSMLHRDPHLFAFGATLRDEKHRAAVLGAIDAEVARLAAGQVDAALLGDVKAHLQNRERARLESPSALALAIARAVGATGDPEALWASLEATARVTADDVAQLARTYLVKDGRIIVDLVSR